MKILIIGGVAGGATAAARLRRLDERAQIIILERSSHVSYANCGLPYYIGGIIRDEAALTVQTPEGLWDRFRIDVRTRHEALAIDRANRTVTVRILDTGKEYTESYDKLLLSPGASPLRPPIPGIDSQGIYALRTVEDALRIRREITEKGLRSAIVVGGGAIGLEMAENLSRLGLRVELVELQRQVLPALDADMASFLHAELRRSGIGLRLGSGVAAFEPCGSGVRVKLADGRALVAGLVLLAVGVSPDSRLAKAAGLALGVRGLIAVNDRMQTSDPDIYAVGDAVAVTDPITGEKKGAALAGPANKQGRIAADNIAGLDSRYRGAAGTAILKLFNLTVAFTGLSERAARAMGLAAEKVILSPVSHAGYYPGGQLMTIKLLFEKKEGRLLGAQIVGGEGVDKRIDVIAAVMQSGGGAALLRDLDLAYAPPFSSAKDPVNMAGYAAENVLAGRVKQVFYEELPSLRGEMQLLDTRTAGESARGRAEGFDINIPLDDLRERLDELERGRPVCVMCQSGLRSYIACRILSQEGFDCYNFGGGYLLYRSMEADRLTREAEAR